MGYLHLVWNAGDDGDVSGPTRPDQMVQRQGGARIQRHRLDSRYARPQPHLLLHSLFLCQHDGSRQRNVRTVSRFCNSAGRAAGAGRTGTRLLQQSLRQLDPLRHRARSHPVWQRTCAAGNLVENGPRGQCCQYRHLAVGWRRLVESAGALVTPSSDALMTSSIPRSIRISLLPNVGLKLSPLLGKGGVAAPIKKMSRSHPSGAQTGWFVQEKLSWSLNEPPRPRLLKERGYFLMARPPLLCQEGDSASPKRSARLNAYTSQGPGAIRVRSAAAGRERHGKRSQAVCACQWTSLPAPAPRFFSSTAATRGHQQNRSGASAGMGRE